MFSQMTKTGRVCNWKRHVVGPMLLAAGTLAAVSGFAQEAPKTVTLQRKSVNEATEINANKYKTREGRLAAKPLDWNSTIGKRTVNG